MIAIKVESVTKQFRDYHSKEETLKGLVMSLIKGKPRISENFTALNNISLEIQRGEAIGIIGQNGSGKTTLLRILARIIYPDLGKVEVNGKLSTLFELGTGFHPDLTGKENVYLNGSILGLSKSEINQKYSGIIEFAGIESFENTPLKFYSSGMQVRLAFSIAININPEILLIDEVLAVGDASFQEKSFNSMQNFKQKGATIVFVSHDLSAIKNFCDRAILLYEGKIHLEGPPEKVISTYKDLLIKNESEEIHKDITKSDRGGDGRAQIKEAWVESETGKKTTLVKDKQIIVKMKVRFFTESDNPIFGITIKDQQNNPIFVTNTMWKNILTGQYKKGDLCIISFKISNVFQDGKYFITPAVAYNNVHQLYDWRNNFIEVLIHKDIKTLGFINMPHEIDLKRDIE